MHSVTATPVTPQGLGPGVTDCHFHIYEADFPLAPGASLRPPPASIAQYRALQTRLGLSRAVIVQPSTYGTDNRLILRVVDALGMSNCRAVAVIDPAITDAQLDALHRGGVRGVRFNLSRPGGPAAQDINRVGERVAELGWHVQLNSTPELLHALAPDLARRYVLVVDHMGHVPASLPAPHPALESLITLLAEGNTYVKLSGFYKVSADGAPHYADAVLQARRLVELAPQRTLWGSDWPHPTEAGKATQPDDDVLFSLLRQVAPDPAVLRHVLINNPARLYGFEPV